MSLAQLSQLLPLGNEELQQILDYAASLSKTEAAAHFQDLLDDSPLAFDFISSFNSERGAQESASTAVTASQSGFEPSEAFAKFKGDSKKKKKGTAIHTPVGRAMEQCQGPAAKAYNKKDQHVDYIPQRASAPDGSQSSRAATTSTLQPPKQHPSTAGYLISDGPQKAKTKSTPKPCTAKVSVAGGTPMTGQSNVLFDLDAVIRALEVMTTLSMDKGKRPKCNCVATRHPLQSAAPNCLACGKVICLKEGLGPCSFCGSLLLSTDEIQAMLRELKDDRGRERMAAHAAAHRKADVAKTPTPFTPRRGEDVGKEGESLAEAASRAREHRDKLLNFQTQNARRTTVRDEAADFDASGVMAGTGNLWASAEERARELKRQQKLMREMEWNVQPDYEKRTQVVSIDLVGGKVVRKMATIERPTTPDEVEAPQNTSRGTKNAWHEGQTGGAFSHNPLLGALMRPVFAPPRDEKGAEQKAGTKRQQTKRWRRVQDDADDNEEVILDGELYGHGSGRTGGEAACG